MPSQQGNNDLNSIKQQLNCSLTEEQIKLLSREELLNNLKLGYFSPKQLQTIKLSQIKDLTEPNANNKVGVFPPKFLLLLSSDQIKAIEPKSFAITLSSKADIEWLKNNFKEIFPKLTEEQKQIWKICMLTKEEIKVLSREKLNDYLQYFSPTQVSYLEPSQIEDVTIRIWFRPVILRLLSPEQIQAIEPESIRKSLFKNNKLNEESLTKKVLSSLSNIQLGFLYDEGFFNTITTEQISWLEPKQITYLTTVKKMEIKIEALSPAQNQRLQNWLIEALTPKIYPSLEEMKNNQYSQPTIKSTKLVTSELHSHKNHSEVVPINKDHTEIWTQTPELNSKPEEVKNNTHLTLPTEIVVEDNKNNSQTTLLVDITNSEAVPINKDQTEIWTKITKNTINNSEAVNISSKSKQKENKIKISSEDQLEKLKVCTDELPKPSSSKGTKKQKQLVAA
ncbi:hypothetical protein [Spiroplasma sp. AdecLV25b]|uniref:hypothetical protein n=1 Tax=Spiroplasma sp. AdecLV25b TaxID=3027162 RepID=UPI0027E0E9A0|nr:hypothetical protein [Spiroplasma sp. AdecLV25b]